MKNDKIKIYKSLILNPVSPDKVEVFNYLVVQNKHIIDINNKINFKDFINFELFDLTENIIIPGLIDTHVHLPQYDNIGLGGQLELLDWLERYTFPTEKKFENKKYTEKISDLFFNELITNGTTTASVFTTIHHNANDIIFGIANDKGIRANIGKVLMDTNSPEYLQEKSDKAIESSKWLIKNWDGKNDGKLHFVVTPRFAGSCSEELLSAAGKLAREFNLRIQTHLSENLNEIKLIKKLFPDYKNYTEVYYKNGLLSEKTILAHCIYLNKSELNLLRKLNCGIAHCPCSNNFLSSGIMPYAKYKELGLKIGLGSDISGGYQMNLFVQMRIAIEVSKFAKLYLKQKSIAKPTDVFYMATLGGAKVLNLDHRIGNFEKNKEADFLVIKNPYLKNNSKQKPELDEILSKVIYCTKPTDILSVYIQGKKIK